MSAVLVDSNIRLDVATNDRVWSARSSGAPSSLAERSVLVVNPIIDAGVSIGFDRIEVVEAALPADIFRREALPFETSFPVGKALRAYRRRGGDKRSPPPDFFIGAHAAVAGHKRLTRDAARYRTYFPKVEVVDTWSRRVWGVQRKTTEARSPRRPTPDPGTRRGGAMLTVRGWRPFRAAPRGCAARDRLSVRLDDRFRTIGRPPGSRPSWTSSTCSRTQCARGPRTVCWRPAGGLGVRGALAGERQ